MSAAMNQPLRRTSRTTLHRRPRRGIYDRDQVEGILDAGLVCHVSTVIDGRPFAMPMAYGRRGDRLFLHGSRHNQLLGALARGVEACVVVTHLDGLVLARSAFHHSMNYRCVVLYGRAVELQARDEKAAALDAIVEQVLAGRSQECRPADDGELDATLVLALPVDEGSAKVRSGPPIDAAADRELPLWAGVLPLAAAAGTPISDGDSGSYPPSIERRMVQAVGWPLVEERRGALLVSTDPARLDIDVLHAFLSEASYWARGIARDRMVRALAGSLCIGAYDGEKQVGFARVITDRASFAYLADVFVLPSHRRRGIASWMLRVLRERPELAGLRRWLLGTRDAHALYERAGFSALARPDWFMEIVGGP